MPNVDPNAPQWHHVLPSLQSEAIMTNDSPNHANGENKAQFTCAKVKPTAAEWQDENRAAILAYNAWVDQNGLPLEEYQQF